MRFVLTGTFWKKEERTFEIDVFLNREIWGLILSRICFESPEEMKAFSIPEFAELEVTQNQFFRQENLIGKSFVEVQEEFARAVGSKE